jgi:hypothetical protein
LFHLRGDVFGVLLDFIPLGKIQMAPAAMSLWTSHENGATFEYQGHTVSLLWQSKQARRIRAMVTAESHAGSLVAGGLVWV